MEGDFNYTFAAIIVVVLCVASIQLLLLARKGFKAEKEAHAYMKEEFVPLAERLFLSMRLDSLSEAEIKKLVWPTRVMLALGLSIDQINKELLTTSVKSFGTPVIYLIKITKIPLGLTVKAGEHTYMFFS